MAIDFIKPRYNGLTIDTECGTTSAHWWGKEVPVYIANLNSEKKSEYQIGPPFTLLVCSPSFLNSSNDEVDGEDLKKAFTQDGFDLPALE